MMQTPWGVADIKDSLLIQVCNKQRNRRKSVCVCMCGLGLYYSVGTKYPPQPLILTLWPVHVLFIHFSSSHFRYAAMKRGFFLWPCLHARTQTHMHVFVGVCENVLSCMWVYAWLDRVNMRVSLWVTQYVYEKVQVETCVWVGVMYILHCGNQMG